MIYLEKMSLQIKEGKHTEYIDKIIKIIIDVSNNPRDNYATWHAFIKILGNLPNDRIPITVFNHVHTWLDSDYDTTLQTAELCDNLLPKFLNDSPTQEDIGKAELILKHLFAIRERDPDEVKRDFESNEILYYTTVRLYFLRASLIDKDLVKKIVGHCSDKTILFLARNLKLVLLNTPAIVGRLKSEPDDYLLRLTISGERLVVSSRFGNDLPKDKTIVEAYESIEEQSLLAIIRKVVEDDGIQNIDEAELQMMIERLNIDFTSLYLREDIADLDDEMYGREDIQHVFARILRQMLREKVRLFPDQITKLFKTLIYDKRYRIAYFKRLVLDALAVNPADEGRIFFWKMVDTKDEDYLKDDKFEAEILRVLKAHAKFFKENEIEKLKQVIAEKVDPESPERNEYWKLRMLTALRENEAFAIEYRSLSEKLNYSYEEAEQSGRSIASIHEFESPYAAETLQEMDLSEIAVAIANFIPERNLREPSLEGFSRALEQAVKNSPAHFSENLECFDELPYTYAYHVLEGFRDAWKNKKEFSWEKVLQFCERYVSREQFGTDALKLDQDGWRADHTFVTGSIGYLITDGTQSDSHAFDPIFLPLAKRILVKLAPQVSPRDRFKSSNMDYVTYVINSTSGRVLRALIDYSLRISRIENNNPTIGSWDADMKYLFESSLERKVLDAYILTGMYYQQFYYLDEEWIAGKFREFYELDQELWLAFMGGLFFANAPFNKQVYELAAPLYVRAIDSNVLPERTLQERNMAAHIGVFYLRGYGRLEANTLIYQFLTRSTPKNIDELVRFMRIQQAHLKKLDKGEWNRYASLVIDLWEFLINMYGDDEQEDYQRMLSDLSGLIGYIDVLDDRRTEILVKTVSYTDRSFNTHELVNHLIELKDRGDVVRNADYIGKILNALALNSYFTIVEKQILKLIEFTYEHGSKELADMFCNKLGINGYLFQKEIFQRYRT
ncbi:MAG TPA: hypothetical protein PKL56_11605 [Cyclobacteriaceae bacterium]|nr:hypothetical protein [Cyclobacteriaceae bacterium]HMX48161.1 hypothetical protein [Cyclobacteriaceae bacterium]HNE96327.1 hypothetical protein [Cyclobacteriaceae bacterium]HNI16190.1 hypothetical protein [Cyclobacteriaceae bacterium]HNK23675.1 hypothetical protein [Cyclobacteriaceae bacterium]